MSDGMPMSRHARVSSTTEPAVLLNHAERDKWATRFGVAPDQIDHDHVISHLLAALATHASQFTFYGGTALSRTFLPDLRLSEDIDLLSAGSRRDVAASLDQAVRDYMEPRFGLVTADPWLASTSRDTQASLFHVGNIDVQIQLIDGTYYTDWPTQDTDIEQRYSDVPPIRLRTYAPRSFVGAKTSAWSETTRNAPRDLYDLWALAKKPGSTPTRQNCSSDTAPPAATPSPGSCPPVRPARTNGSTRSATNASHKSAPPKRMKPSLTPGPMLSPAQE